MRLLSPGWLQTLTFYDRYRKLLSQVLPEEPTMSIRIRQAVPRDVPTLATLIDTSVRGLQSREYTPSQIESALETVYGVDSQLIADGTYFVAEAESCDDAGRASSQSVLVIVGCGGWSKRKTLYGGDQWKDREAALLDPKSDAAKIRAFFIHPSWARRGIGSMLLEACENAAIEAGFSRLEMGSTLTGVPLYQARGYIALANLEVPLGNGEVLPIVHMEKRIHKSSR
jgi:N-acetylglutamate synthase-like GNAT family acetyltransferase